MAKLVFGMNQSLDGYVDHMAFAPGPTLFRHFIEETTSCLVTASHISPDPGRRSGLSLMIGLARM